MFQRKTHDPGYFLGYSKILTINLSKTIECFTMRFNFAGMDLALRMTIYRGSPSFELNFLPTLLTIAHQMGKLRELQL